MSKDYFGLLLLWGGTILYGLATCYFLFQGTERYITSLVLPIATIFFLWKRQAESGIFLRVTFFTQFIYYSLLLLFMAGVAIPLGYHNEQHMWFLGGLEVAFLAAAIFSSKRRELFSTDEENDRGKKKLAVIVLAICIPVLPVIEHFARPILDPQVISNKQDIQTIYFSQDGNWIGVKSVGSVSLWNVAKKKSNVLIPSSNQVRSMAIDSSLNYVALGEYVDKNNMETRGIELLAMKSGARTNIVPKEFIASSKSMHVDIKDIIFSPDDSYLAAVVTGEKKSAIGIWNISDGKLIRMIESNAITIAKYQNLAYSPNGENVAASSSDNEVGIWDATTGNLVRIVSKKFHGTLQEIKYSPDGKYLAIASKKRLSAPVENIGTHKSYLEIWDVENGELYKSLSFEGKNIDRFSYSYDGKYIATSNISDDFVKIWDVESEELIHIFYGPEIKSILGGDIQDVIFSPDGRYLAVASGKYIKLYDARKIGK